ncbi:hypothetical protein PFISCL1PPCAC_10174, partial [Pristionchus fissidentatus]
MEGTTNWKNVHAISIFTFVDSLQFSFYMWSFWPYIQQIDSTMGATFVGIIMAISGVGEAVSSPIFGYWCNRVGRITPAVQTSIVFSSVGNLLYLFLGSFSRSIAPIAIILSRFLSGAGSGNRGCFRALVAHNSQGVDRAKALASSGGAALVGLTIGPAIQLIFNWMGPDGVSFGPFTLSQYTAPALLALFINLSTAIYIHYFLDDSLVDNHLTPTLSSTAYIVREDELEHSECSRTTSIPLRMDVVAVIICMATRSIRMLATSNVESIGAPFTEIMFNFTHAEALEWNSYDQTIVGVLTIAVFLLYAFTNYTRWVSERSNCIIAIIGLFFFYSLTMPWPFLSGNVDCTRFIGNGTHNWEWCETLPPLNQWLYYSTYAVIYGICLPMLNNSLQALYSRVLGDGPQGTMQGVNQAVGSIARIFGPLLMSWTFSQWGPQATWALNIGLIGITIGVWIIACKRLVPLELRRNNSLVSKACSLSSCSTTMS